MDQQYVEETTDKMMAFLELPENSHLLFAVLMNFIDAQGRVNDDFSFMYHFADTLALQTEEARRTSNYKGPDFYISWRNQLNKYDDGWSGAFEGYWCRILQDKLFDKYMQNLPKAVEGDLENYSDLQKKVVEIRRKRLISL